LHRKCLASFEGEKINALVPKSWHNVTIKQLVSLDLKVASYKSMVQGKGATFKLGQELNTPSNKHRNFESRYFMAVKLRPTMSQTKFFWLCPGYPIF
jgi:hypothetical protein